jgi:hypothetical protein
MLVLKTISYFYLEIGKDNFFKNKFKLINK